MPTPDFVALADLIAARAHAAARATEVPEPVAPIAAASDAPGDDAIDAAVAAAISDARVFRARLDDALRDAFGTLLAALAADVLGRELRAAPCDLHALLEHASDRAPAVRVRVAPDDAAGVTGFAVLPDAALLPGDAVIELDGGAIDARLGVRLAAVLARFA